MPANDKTMAVVREWVVKAENDLKSAAYLLKMKDCPVDNTQQSVKNARRIQREVRKRLADKPLF